MPRTDPHHSVATLLGRLGLRAPGALDTRLRVQRIQPSHTDQLAGARGRCKGSVDGRAEQQPNVGAIAPNSATGQNARSTCKVFEAESVVGQFRWQLDRNAVLGVPAHVTVLAPFLLPDRIGPQQMRQLARWPQYYAST
jgi:hypothetical protein